MNAAERIYNASTRGSESPTRLTEKLARRIEDDIAFHKFPAGDTLGSLRNLSERYSVGRAVIREAIGLLERRGLGKLRPGPCGGFIVKKPQSDVISEELVDYFRAVGILLPQLLDAREAVDLMALRLATTARANPIGLARLELAGQTASLAGHLAVRNEIARLTLDPLVILLVKCLNSLTLDFGCDELETDGARLPPLNTTVIRQALARGDVELAISEQPRLHSALAQHLRPRVDQTETPSIEDTHMPHDRTLATSVARRLAAEIVRSDTTGQRLGSEWDLCERFSVSRLTLRQAIRLLQDRGLVECRRGRGNGLVVRNYRSTGTIRLVIAYLIGRQMGVKTAGTILFQLNCFMPALAVSRADTEQRQRLDTLLARVENSDPFDRYDLLNLVHCVSQLADSPIIDLFSRCLAAYEARFHPSLAERLPASVQAGYFRHVRQLLNQMPDNRTYDLAQAKLESSRVMLEMSQSRPI